MSQELWSSVDDYINEVLVASDPALESALASSAAAGLPAIAVSPAQGKFLFLLARFGRAHRILEIGTLGGYSTIWMARALPPHGRLISMEMNARHAEVAVENIARADLQNVEVRVGPALESLQLLESEEPDPFDLTFIDADKENIPQYFEWALRLSRPGSLIVVDNVIRGGAVVDPNGDASVQGVRRFNEMIATERRVSATAIQTVGVKGYDGFAMVMVLR